MKSGLSVILLSACLLFSLTSCQSVDDDRIPAMPVNISLADAGTWNIYGVFGFGQSTNFILTPGTRVPYGFPYNAMSATGFGGVLLISGLDTYTGLTDAPLAYDLSCPVERSPEIRVAILPETLNAQCPVCKSVYDVTVGAGGPISGPAASGKHKYGLKRYHCVESGQGGYFIIN